MHSCARLIDYLGGWLLAFALELKSKCSAFVQYDGERASLREKKLTELADEYYTKYDH